MADAFVTTLLTRRGDGNEWIKDGLCVTVRYHCAELWYRTDLECAKGVGTGRECFVSKMHEIEHIQPRIICLRLYVGVRYRGYVRYSSGQRSLNSKEITIIMCVANK